MTARLRLAIAGSALAVLLGAWVLWFTVVRDSHNPSGQHPKTTAEQLIGTWVITKQDPPFPSNITVNSEFTEDGKAIIRITESRRGPLAPRSGLYQLNDETIRFDFEDSDNPGGALHTWKARIESITDHRLILVGIDGETKSVEYERK